MLLPSHLVVLLQAAEPCMHERLGLAPPLRGVGERVGERIRGAKRHRAEPRAGYCCFEVAVHHARHAMAARRQLLGNRDERRDVAERAIRGGDDEVHLHDERCEHL